MEGRETLSDSPDWHVLVQPESRAILVMLSCVRGNRKSGQAATHVS